MVRSLVIALAVCVSMAASTAAPSAVAGSEELENCGGFEIDAERVICCTARGKAECLTILGAPKR